MYAFRLLLDNLCRNSCKHPRAEAPKSGSHEEEEEEEEEEQQQQQQQQQVLVAVVVSYQYADVLYTIIKNWIIV